MLFPQIAGRPTGLLTGHHATLCLFSDIPAYRSCGPAGCRSTSSAAALADPELRRRITSWTPSSPAQAAAMEKAYERTFVLGDPPDYEPGPERSLAGVAAARGMTPLEVAYDEMARDSGHGAALSAHPQLRHGRPRPRARDAAAPAGLLGLSDGGAHTGTICDASMPTFMLTHWTRDRSRGATLPLEYVVKKQTHDTARLYGLSDRGTVEPGALGDLNLIDYDDLTLGAPFVARRPAGRAAAACSSGPRGTWSRSRRGRSPSRMVSPPGSTRAGCLRGALTSGSVRGRRPGRRRARRRWRSPCPRGRSRRRDGPRAGRADCTCVWSQPQTQYALRDGMHVGIPGLGRRARSATASTCWSSTAGS